MTTHPRLAGGLLALALVGPSVSSNRSIAQSTLLTDEEMQATVGGVYVNSFNLPPVDNWSQAQDNPQFQLNVMNPYSSTVTVGLFEGTSKYAAGLLSWTNGASGTLQMRSPNWPLSTTKRDVVLKFNGEGTWYTADGASTRNDAYLHSGLKITKVRFYHLQETGAVNPTSVGHSLVSLIDNTATFTYDWHTTAAVDAITQQCLQDKRWNFRYETTHNSETVATGCTNIRWGRGCGGTGQPTCASGTGDQCPNWNTVVGNMVNARAAAAGFSVFNYVHVVFVNSFQKWNSTTNSYDSFAGWSPGDNNKFVVVQDSLDASTMSRVIAHEIGHKQGLCHPDEAGCTQGSNDCATPVADRNLMCSIVGRELLSSQCDILSANTQFVDWLF